MLSKRIVVMGHGGLLGEILLTELAQHTRVMTIAECDALIHLGAPVPDGIVVWAEATEIGHARRRLRQSLPAQANPILLFLSQIDPHIYFTRLRDLHVERRKLGFNEVINEISGRIAAGSTTTATARAGSV